MWKIASQALMWERNAFPSPCPEWAPFTSPAISTTFRKAGTLLKRQNSRKRRIIRWCRHHYKSQPAVITHTWQVCGTGRGTQSVHLEQVPCSHLGQLCRKGSFLQQLGFWSAHWKTWIFCNTTRREWWSLTVFPSNYLKQKKTKKSLITCPYPTLGNPTIPIFRDVPNRPINGGCFGASVFFGGICES